MLLKFLYALKTSNPDNYWIQVFKLINFFLLWGLVLNFSINSSANNLVLRDITLNGRKTSSDYILVQFDISWDNSWRTSVAPSNWDAAWVYIKYRKLSETTGSHATLNRVVGTGSGDGVEVNVMGIEMVYVPPGSFYVGSGGTEAAAFYTYPTTTNPYQINNESAITIGTSAGNLYYPDSPRPGDQSGPVPETFPKGYNAFYCMKYEISQEQYVVFLNKINLSQQNERTVTDLSPGISSVTNRFVMSNSPTMTYLTG